jgi:pSer/pThr/pTyr-binding forkhead associated (FHA) protein
VIDIVSGPQQGRSIELVKDRILIGRDTDCDISLQANRYLSRFHSQLVKKDEGYELEDLQSANGSYVNGLQVNGRLKLKDGDRIHAGETILVYRTCD